MWMGVGYAKMSSGLFWVGKNKSPGEVGVVSDVFFGESMVLMPDIPTFPILWNIPPDKTLVKIYR
jgi:hypothetical protein